MFTTARILRLRLVVEPHHHPAMEQPLILPINRCAGPPPAQVTHKVADGLGFPRLGPFAYRKARTTAIATKAFKLVTAMPRYSPSMTLSHYARPRTYITWKPGIRSRS
jgi:hypothetical protein